MTDRSRKVRTTRAQNAVFKLEDRIRDARSKGEWCEVGRLEKQLEIAMMRYKGALAREDIAERRVWRKF